MVRTSPLQKGRSCSAVPWKLYLAIHSVPDGQAACIADIFSEGLSQEGESVTWYHESSPVKLRSEPPRCGQHQRPAGQSMRPGEREGAQGVPGACGTKRCGCEERVRRDGQAEAGGRPRGGGPGGKKGGRGGGGRESGRKQCSRPGPSRVPLPSAATEVRLRSVAPGAAPDAGSGAAGAPRAPRRAGSDGHRLAGAQELLAGGRPRQRRGQAVTPREPHAGRTPRQGAGWGGSGRAAASPAAAAERGSPRAPLGGSSQARPEEERPGSSARGGAPARGSLLGVRRGVGWRGVSPRGGAPCRAPRALREVCPHPRPAPSCQPAAGAPE